MKEFKKPDLTAPRFRPEVYNVLNNAWHLNLSFIQQSATLGGTMNTLGMSVRLVKD